MASRLGIDIGTNSIGWCVFDLDGGGEPTGIRDIGVRIFTDGRDPKKGTSLAEDRRVARGQRRRRDRYLRRRRNLINTLVRHGLMPADAAARKALERTDPYALRLRGLDLALGLHEFGRAIFHLSQRRGFRSNRRAQAGEAKKEAGKIKVAAEKLERLMAETGARTVGEFLARRHAEKKPVRARFHGEGAKAEYDFYPQRDMVAHEFDALWAVQARHHPQLTDGARDEIRHVIFHQRPLRPVRPGKCALDPARDENDLGGLRAPWALPSAQRFRIHQELANLRIGIAGRWERPLAVAERDRLARELFRKKFLKFERMRGILDLDPLVEFNLASAKRDGLDGDETAALLGKKGLFNRAWHALALDRQDAIVERLLAEEDEKALIAWLRDGCGLDAVAAEAVADVDLPDGYCRIGRRALARLIPVWEREGAEFTDLETGEVYRRPLTYAEACARAGYDHADRRPGELLDALPYYGAALADQVFGTGDPGDGDEDRWGRIPNPTVHIGLNQLRRVINRLIARHGRPAEIVVEVARELKQGRKEKERIQKEQAENQKRNDERRALLAEHGQPDTGENRMRLRLWEELNPGNALDRRCVYTGTQIGLERLFSDAIQVDHILPFSRTLDDGIANRILCVRAANRAKTNHSPHEAFCASPTIDGIRYAWDEIAARAQALPPNKRWRFAPDAMKRFDDEERGFLARQLTDTAYLARLTHRYLAHVCPANKVWAIPGRLTAMLRGKWGLNTLLPDANFAEIGNQKSRKDHRHHAIDAFVAGVTDRGMLQRIARAAEASRDRLIADMPLPWEGFRDQLRDAVNQVVVSHRPDHGVQGRLHEDTAYGIVAAPAREEGHNLVYRKPFPTLNENEIARIRDRELRRRVQEHVAAAMMAGQTLKQALADFQRDHKIRHVRLLKKEADVVPIRDRAGRPYKSFVPGDNHHVDVFAPPDGAWGFATVTTFDANRANAQPPWKKDHPAARLVMRVHKGDLLKLKVHGQERVMRVVQLAPSAKRFHLAPHMDAGNLQERHDDADDPFRWFFASFGRLRELGCRKVRVDEIGRVHDPRTAPMIGRVVEIAEDRRHLSAERGFLVVSTDGAEIGRVPLDDIAVVVINAHGVTYSNNVVVALAERGIAMVVCGANHGPVAWLWPADAHHAQTARMEAQIEATKPLAKRLWQALVHAKVLQQAAVVEIMGKPSGGIAALARKVRSGDPDNIEAQAARRYWPLLMGPDFRRDRSRPGVNGFLNYGYTVLRAATARAVMAAGLHPSIGLHHRTRSDALCLASDLMEPFRPLVDLAAARLAAAGKETLAPEVKAALAGVMVADMETSRGTTPLATCLDRLAASLAASYEGGEPSLDLPHGLLPLDVAELGKV